jgi:mRNA interferase MazF
MPAVHRGEIWIVDLGMAAKPRPAVILSIAPLDHERALITYVPRTTSLRGTRFEVAHQARGFEPGGFDA